MFGPSSDRSFKGHLWEWYEKLDVHCKACLVYYTELNRSNWKKMNLKINQTDERHKSGVVNNASKQSRGTTISTMAGRIMEEVRFQPGVV